MTPRTNIQVINDWPGSGDRGERKVQTTLIYNGDNTVSSWGFLCDDDDDGRYSNYALPPGQGGRVRREFFKIFLDDETLRAAQRQGLARAPQSPEEARRFVTDYLAKVYEHVKETVETQTGVRYRPGGWDEMAVEFVFSVPTTWTSHDIINISNSV